MDPNAVSCPVCTLYLRPGITLKSHLASHPKQKVIDALCRLSNDETTATNNTEVTTINTAILNQSWNHPPHPDNLVASLPHAQANHVFIYQQSSCTTGPQYVIPTVLNPPQMPYIFQQQLLMSNAPFELTAPSTSSAYNNCVIIEENDEDEDKYNAIEENEDKACQTVDEGPKSPVFCETAPEQFEYVELDGMQVVINDFSPGPIISQVEHFDSEHRPGVLMTIGDYVDDDSVNIRADERLPPRGELSGQESVGSSSDAAYDLLTRETWSDASSEMPPLEETKPSAVVIKQKVVDDLIVKIKETNSFDNVFTNKLKMETTEAEVKPKVEEEPKAKHKCATCDEQFPNDYKYTEHLRIHPLECQICGRLFYRRQNIQLHMRRHLGIKPYKCDVCAKAFLTKQKLEEHRNVHTGDAPIKCTQCEQTFRRHSNLVQHRNRHHLNVKRKLKDYICGCKEVFHSKKKLAWHMEVHEARPKSCTQCSEKFIHMSSLTRHMRRAHNERFLPKGSKGSENVKCPVCGQVILKSSLEVHIRNHSGNRPFSCLICNKDFTTKWNLKLHKWTHASRVSKPFKCDQCKGAFIRESDYTAHMNSHKSVRPYTCNYCGAQFIRKYNCQRHVKEHENEKSYDCKVCGKTFHRSYYLKDHMRIHSGLRPFSCHICGKTSTTKSNHNKHVQIHHAREPVSTEN